MTKKTQEEETKKRGPKEKFCPELVERVVLAQDMETLRLGDWETEGQEAIPDLETRRRGDGRTGGQDGSRTRA